MAVDIAEQQQRKLGLGEGGCTMHDGVVCWGVVWWVLMCGPGGYHLLRRAGISNGGVFCCCHGDEQQQRQGEQCGCMEPGLVALPHGEKVWPGAARAKVFYFARKINYVCRRATNADNNYIVIL